MSEKEVKKVVVVGDVGSGKTSIAKTFYGKKCVGNSVVYPTMIFDVFLVDLTLGIPEKRIMIVDLSGDDNWAYIRKRIYPETDIFIIVYDISRRQTLTNAFLKWYPEVSQHCPEAPIIFVGNKTDLRTTGSDREVRHAEGEIFARTMSARAYVECSALLDHNVGELFAKVGDVLFPSCMCPLL